MECFAKCLDGSIVVVHVNKGDTVACLKSKIQRKDRSGTPAHCFRLTCNGKPLYDEHYVEVYRTRPGDIFTATGRLLGGDDGEEEDLGTEFLLMIIFFGLVIGIPIAGCIYRTQIKRAVDTVRSQLSERMSSARVSRSGARISSSQAGAPTATEEA